MGFVCVFRYNINFIYQNTSNFRSLPLFKKQMMCTGKVIDLSRQYKTVSTTKTNCYDIYIQLKDGNL